MFVLLNELSVTGHEFCLWEHSMMVCLTALFVQKQKKNPSLLPVPSIKLLSAWRMMYDAVSRNKLMYSVTEFTKKKNQCLEMEMHPSVNCSLCANMTHTAIVGKPSVFLQFFFFSDLYNANFHLPELRCKKRLWLWKKIIRTKGQQSSLKVFRFYFIFLCVCVCVCDCHLQLCFQLSSRFSIFAFDGH